MASIFYDPANISPEKLNVYCKDSMSDHMGIQFTEIGPDFLKAEMTVSPKTVQPLRMLNGGASLAIAECVGSLAANLVIDRSLFVALGLDLNGNHLKAVPEGQKVTATARPFHLGKRTQVWEIRIENEEGILVHISRLTMSVIPI
jgi:1,4-dihydroxy-2-naphthoyl-CoA hydrolase